MNSSPSLSPGRPPQAEAQTAGAAIEPFPYEMISAGGRSGVRPFAAGGDELIAAELQEREAQARLQGKQEGQAEARQNFEREMERTRSGISAALAQFTRDRAAYFQKIEGEVVQLALSIARKILHRESQLDPLLLAGMARVALEKIDGATGVRLRLHPANAADWQRYLSTHLEPSDLPEIVEDPAQPLEQCTLETSMGTAAIGLEVELKEIEQGLMDLLAARPGNEP